MALSITAQTAVASRGKKFSIYENKAIRQNKKGNGLTHVPTHQIVRSRGDKTILRGNLTDQKKGGSRRAFPGNDPWACKKRTVVCSPAEKKEYEPFKGVEWTSVGEKKSKDSRGALSVGRTVVKGHGIYEHGIGDSASFNTT